MAWTRRFKLPTLKPESGTNSGDESGIALFMVIAAMTILSVIVTEFTYVAQVNSRATVDASDQLKAHYLAKTGYKLSLLRLRAYKEIKAFGGKDSGLPEVPKALLDQIWSFPFFYPIPSNAPGMTMVMKDEVEKFQTDSTLPGHFTATIESESNRIGLNSLLAVMAPPGPAPSPSAKPGASNGANPGTAPNPNPSPSAKVDKYDVEEARKGFHDMIAQILDDKFKADPDFAAEYRDTNVDELYDNILGWVDYNYQPKNMSGHQLIAYKKQPFYSMSELRMIYPIDDALYDVIAPNFTTFTTPGINVNTIKEPMLRAIFPNVKDEEVKKFFEDRDSTERDGKFKAADDFFKYVQGNFGAYRNSTDDVKARLTKQGIQILVDETVFKITVVAEVNKASRILEAWVVLDSQSKSSGNKQGTNNQTNTPNTQNPNPGASGTPDPNQNAAGLRLLYMQES